MDILEIAAKADSYVRKYKTRNPFVIAEALGVEIMPIEMQKLKGCFKVIKRNPFIFVNAFMEEAETVWVLGHELGHNCLHRHLAAMSSGLMEYSLYDMTARPEREANLFAAELLIDEEDLLEYIYDYGYTAEQCAQALNIHPAFIALKIEILNARGYDLRMQDYDRKFLN